MATGGEAAVLFDGSRGIMFGVILGWFEGVFYTCLFSFCTGMEGYVVLVSNVCLSVGVLFGL